MALVHALQRAPDSDAGQLFVIKGGTAIELRLRRVARMTRDIDATFHGTRSELDDMLERAFATSISGFTMRASPPEAIGVTGALRVTVRLRYQLRPWGTIDLELGIV